MNATNWLARQVTKAELKELKAKSRKAKDPITREWYAALLEGMKESPWYSDDNAPSLYRDRYMRFVAIVVVAIVIASGSSNSSPDTNLGTMRF